MPNINFTNVSVVGQPQDQSLQVSAMQSITIRVFTELGNGALGNGGADGQYGIPNIDALSFETYAREDYFGLRKTDYLNQPRGNERSIPLKMSVTQSKERSGGAVLYTDIILTPLPDGKVGLSQLSTYAFAYTAALPGLWVDAGQSSGIGSIGIKN